MEVRLVNRPVRWLSPRRAQVLFIGRASLVYQRVFCNSTVRDDKRVLFSARPYHGLCVYIAHFMKAADHICRISLGRSRAPARTLKWSRKCGESAFVFKGLFARALWSARLFVVFEVGLVSYCADPFLGSAKWPHFRHHMTDNETVRYQSYDAESRSIFRTQNRGRPPGPMGAPAVIQYHSFKLPPKHVFRTDS